MACRAPLTKGGHALCLYLYFSLCSLVTMKRIPVFILFIRLHFVLSSFSWMEASAALLLVLHGNPAQINMWKVIECIYYIPVLQSSFEGLPLYWHEYFHLMRVSTFPALGFRGQSCTFSCTALFLTAGVSVQKLFHAKHHTCHIVGKQPKVKDQPRHWSDDCVSGEWRKIDLLSWPCLQVLIWLLRYRKLCLCCIQGNKKSEVGNF